MEGSNKVLAFAGGCKQRAKLRSLPTLRWFWFCLGPNFSFHTAPCGRISWLGQSLRITTPLPHGTLKLFCGVAPGQQRVRRAAASRSSALKLSGPFDLNGQSSFLGYFPSTHPLLLFHPSPAPVNIIPPSHLVPPSSVSALTSWWRLSAQQDEALSRSMSCVPVQHVTV